MLASLEKAQTALADADWETARDAFVEALASEESAAGRDGLGLALWWLGDVRGGMEERERAYLGYLDGKRPCEAAAMALWLGGEHAAAFGNHAVASGWFSRAERLLATEGPCRGQGLLLLRRARQKETPADALAIYDQVLTMGRELGMRDLELLALSYMGTLLVNQGRMAEGFARLDEAMSAAVAGELREHAVVAVTSCNMLLACEQAHDLGRAAEWLRVSTDWAKQRRCLPFFAFCRVTCGSVLMAQGRWSEAEDELVDSIRRYEATHPALCAKATVKLVELRIAQGQFAEAEELLRPWRDHPLATCAVASLHLAHGETELAVSLLERRIEVGRHDPSIVAPLSELLVTAHLARGERTQARSVVKHLRALERKHPGPVISAIAEAAAGEVEGACGEATATTSLQRAVDAYTGLGMPYAAARVRLSLARALAKVRREAAVSEARAALATFEHLGSAPAAEAAARFLEAACGGPRPVAKRRSGVDALTGREREVLRLLRVGRSNPEVAEALDISARTAEHHVRAILAKLGLPTRAAAAAWAERQEREVP